VNKVPEVGLLNKSSCFWWNQICNCHRHDFGHTLLCNLRRTYMFHKPISVKFKGWLGLSISSLWNLKDFGFEKVKQGKFFFRINFKNFHFSSKDQGPVMSVNPSKIIRAKSCKTFARVNYSCSKAKLASFDNTSLRQACHWMQKPVQYIILHL